MSWHGGTVRHLRGKERGTGDYNFESVDAVMLEHGLHESNERVLYIHAKNLNQVLYCYLCLYSFQGDKQVGMLIEWEMLRIRE